MKVNLIKTSKEAHEAQEIHCHIMTSEGHARDWLPILVKNTRRSWCQYNSHITIARNTFDEIPTGEYFYAIVIHETCHQLAHLDGGRNHDFTFRQYEIKWLREFGLQAKYMRAYWKHLATLDGTVIWSNWRYRDKQSLRAASDYFRKGN